MRMESAANRMVPAEVYAEGGADAAENGYQRYRALGGIINERDYESALAKAKETAAVNGTVMDQAETMMQVAGIKLGPEASKDPRIVLYGILRNDENTSGAKHHHSQMDDQSLFVEALRMLGDEESLKKFIESHPHISF